MDRINGAGHVDHMFVAEDPATLRPPTEITPEWMNTVQEELVAIATMNGAALNPAVNTQSRDAITAYLQSRIDALINASPAALDTLKELADALGDDPNFAATITNALSLKAQLNSPALTGAPTAPTPAQFDNSTKLATSEFVRSALGNMANIATYSVNTTLTAADFGKDILIQATGLTLTLPAANSAPTGSRISLQVAVAGGTATVQRAGTDTIETGGAGPLTSIPLLGGDSIVFVTNGTSGWFLVGGVGQAKYSKAFDSSLGSTFGSNSYQKLPSGLIIQSGFIAAGTSGASWSFPIAFPNICLGAFATNGSAIGSPSVVVSLGTPSTTAISAYTNTGTATANIWVIGK